MNSFQMWFGPIRGWLEPGDKVIHLHLTHWIGNWLHVCSKKNGRIEFQFVPLMGKVRPSGRRAGLARVVSW